MCTAITYTAGDHYFGRTLDLDYSYDEQIIIAPRNYPFRFRKVKDLSTHYAIIGVAYVVDQFPLYYDALNERGLAIAGLRFPNSTCYPSPCEGKEEVSPFEFIPWLLGQCANVSEVRHLLEHTNLAEIPFNDHLPVAPLHWLLTDGIETITLEHLSDGLMIYENSVGVLTNEPPFPFQMTYLNNYMNITRDNPTNRFCSRLPLNPYSLGMGAIGLPGDFSSSSRFVKAAFVKMNSVSEGTGKEGVSQFFHILDSVAQVRGTVCLGEGAYMMTHYTSCCNLDRGDYYYTTYGNRQIIKVSLFHENLERHDLISYPQIRTEQIRMEN